METELIIKYRPLIGKTIKSDDIKSCESLSQDDIISIENYHLIQNGKLQLEWEQSLTINALPNKSARQCIEILRPINNFSILRTIDGQPMILAPVSNKYNITIRCEDLNSPILNVVSVGNILQIGCLTYFWQRVDDNDMIVLLKKPIDDSVEIYGNNQSQNVMITIEDNVVYLSQKINSFIKYRPWMTVVVKDFKIEKHEWGKKNLWILEMEEL